MPRKKSTATQTDTEPSTKPNATPSLRFSTRQLGIATIIIAIAIVLFLARGLFVAATVNGQPISRLAVIRSLEQQSGRQVLDSLVTEALIRQEASEQGVAISDERVNARIQSIADGVGGEDQFDALLAQQGVTRSRLQEQIRTQLLVEEMVLGEDAVADDEIDAFLEEQAEQLGLDDANLEEARETARRHLVQQKLNEQASIWLQQLRDEASIRYFAIN